MVTMATMAAEGSTPVEDDSSRSTTTTNSEEEVQKKMWRLWVFLAFLVFDGLVSILLYTPLPISFVSRIEHLEGVTTDHYTLYGNVWDIGILSGVRVITALLGILIMYEKGLDGIPREYAGVNELYHPNGEKKSQEDLELEAMEESFWPWFQRYASRPTFVCEMVCVVTQLLCIIKALARMYYEIGTMEDTQPLHPILWIVIACTTFFAIIETIFVQSIGKLAAKAGAQNPTNTTRILHRIGSTLSIPLLSETDENGNGGAGEGEEEDVEKADDDDNETDDSNSEAVGLSDITGDAKYKAKMSDLLKLCYPDIHYIILAFIFLVLAAIAQVYIPKLTGNILDSLTQVFADTDDNNNNNNIKPSMFDVPGFMPNIRKLILAAFLGGLFSGCRGSIFTFVGGRVNIRLRVQLMDALLCQDIGFFDTTKTGEITSRLSSDTTLVSDQVMLNVNVFLRSLLQAVGVLIFMFVLSWQLSLLAFISVPVVTILGRWYGEFLRSLSKLMQKKLADGNSVSEAVLSSMSTVRAFDATEDELHEFESSMREYLALNLRQSIAYCGFSGATVALPQLVVAVVVFYGGLLVRNGDMTSGELVSFILYLQSLSDAFASIGWIFSAITQAVGAADKVFELMNRKPKIKVSSSSRQQFSLSTAVRAQAHARANRVRALPGAKATMTSEQRRKGLYPETCDGEIILENVQMYYPARPKRRVLNGLSMRIPPGSVVALVGQSGGGKSSVMSLVQHLYDTSAGKVLLDGIEVHELSPSWLAKHVSVVSQEPTLFARSIKRNIMYGLENEDRKPTDEEVIEAARLANADSFIQSLPQGYGTECGERGVQLSGGQKQRIAIARALIRKPKVLLLDEATSALDSESEHMVQQAIDEMISRGREGSNSDDGMTVMIVAHRLSTVRNADVIFVIQDGQVVEQGTHTELIQKVEGPYASLVSRQMEAEKKLAELGKNNGTNTTTNN